MQLTKNSRVIPKKGHKLDKYEGPVDPVTKLRHGRGIYHYDNTFFTYQGEYLQGKKNGQGLLKLKDGTVIRGTFQNDELTGQAQITYSHGAKYKGYLNLGEKSGQGLFQSIFEEYDGEWKENCKSGKGVYKNLSIGQVYEGEFERNKPHGKGKLTRWNYCYEGQYRYGQKDGEGKEVNDWPRQQDQQCVGRYEFTGVFKQDRFEGEGEYRSRQSNYVYIGNFSRGLPVLYPNQFRVLVSINTKNGEEVCEGEKTIVTKLQPLQYELEGDSINLIIETAYQGPEELDPVQPTPEQIDNMVKNWQNENKKNKNPPPMPDFNQPRMKKPDLVLVAQESGRTVRLQLLRENQGKEEVLKIDYRAEIAAKRKENEELRQQALKKAEEDGGKKGGKKDNKGQPELKVNLFKAAPIAREQRLDLLTKEGTTVLKEFELPDDFPPGKYFLEISSPFKDFGTITKLRKEINIKAKAVGKKK